VSRRSTGRRIGIHARSRPVHRTCHRLDRRCSGLIIERMHETKPATRNRKRRSSSLRSEALRFFEQCERGLVAAYRALPPGLLSLRDSNRLAALHENHATLLADCLDRDGGRSAADPHDLWITEPTVSGMRVAEQTSFTTYRDHLATLAPATARMIRTQIMPDHYRAAEHLAEVAARRGRSWRHPIHRPPSPLRTTARQARAGRQRTPATRRRRGQAR